MDTATYEAMRQFADSWGLLYMLAIFLVVLAYVMRPGARMHAETAARIPLDDNHPAGRDPQP